MIAGSLRNRNYRIYTAGNAASLIGIWIQRVAAGWLAWEITNSGFWLGLVAFGDLFPTVVLGPYAGALADRHDRLKVARIAQHASTLQALVLTVLAAGGGLTIELLIVLTLLLGIAGAFSQPARLSLMPALVPRSDLANVVAINSLVFNVARFVGPAIAGFLLVIADMWVTFAVVGLTYVAFSYALARLQLAPEVRMPAVSGGTRTLEGLAYVKNQFGLGRILFMMSLTGIGLRPVVELLPGFAAELYETSAIGLAVLTSAMGLSSVAAGLWLGTRGAKGLTGIVLITNCTAALGAMAFVAAPGPWAAIVALAVTGYCLSAAGIGTQTLVQLSVDDGMRGRVLSIYGIIFRGAPAIGALFVGVVSERFGLHSPILWSAFLVLCASLWILLRRVEIAASLEDA